MFDPVPSLCGVGSRLWPVVSWLHPSSFCRGGELTAASKRWADTAALQSHGAGRGVNEEHRFMWLSSCRRLGNHPRCTDT